MPYTIEWKPQGAVKRFQGRVDYDEILQSEKDISGSIHFRSLRFVLSDFLDADYRGITESQRQDINAMRIGAYFGNGRIKYAFVMRNPAIEAQIHDAVASGDMLFETRVFDNLAAAEQWIGADLPQRPA